MPPKQQRPRRAPEVTAPAPTAGRRRPREEEADDAERPARRTSSRRVHEERNAAAEAVQSQDLRINDVQRIRHTIRMMDHIIVVEADSSHNFGDLLPLLTLGMWSVMTCLSLTKSVPSPQMGRSVFPVAAMCSTRAALGSGCRNRRRVQLVEPMSSPPHLLHQNQQLHTHHHRVRRRRLLPQVLAQSRHRAPCRRFE